jgi:hypothetical protein
LSLPVEELAEHLPPMLNIRSWLVADIREPHIGRFCVSGKQVLHGRFLRVEDNLFGVQKI